MSDSETPTETAHGPTELDLTPMLKRSWALFSEQPVVHVLATVLLVGVSTLTLSLATGPLVVGYIRLIRRQAAGQAITLGQIWDDVEPVPAGIVVWLALVLAAAIGSSLLVLPGVLAVLFWGFAPWHLAFNASETQAALRGAYELARAELGGVLLTLLVATTLVVLGLATVLGAIIALPVGVIFLTLAYEALNQ